MPTDMNLDFYIGNSYKLSKSITKQYSTSFSIATSLLEKEQREAVFAIYGFVRLADEVVDSFHGFDNAYLLHHLNEQVHYALREGISTNPILMAFADVALRYNIPVEHVDAFMESMAFDLTKTTYADKEELNTYIYGSAEVVGLMCLRVFCSGDAERYKQLEPSARALGSAFQKVNFLRDIKEDTQALGRTYFPEIARSRFDKKTKEHIERSIENDFAVARTGLAQLPGRSKLAVGIAYFYFYTLFEKIKRTSPETLLSERLRISNFRKYLILMVVGFRYKTKQL